MKVKAYSLLLLILLASFGAAALVPAPNITTSVEPAFAEAGTKTTISVHYDFPEGMYQILQEEYFFFEIEPKPGFRLGEITYPDGETDEFGFLGLKEEAVISADLMIDRSVSEGDYELTLIAGYQLCYEETGACIMPDEKEMTIFVSVLPATGANQLWLYLIFALLGGFILNLTPCVLPVLSLRAFSLINQSQSDRKKITINSLVYSLGILFSFLVLAVIIIALKTTGQLVGWGFQFQNPVFVIVMTSVLFVFSLSLFDVFTIMAPEPGVAGKLSRKEGYAGAFFMGIFAVLLGTPCTAPILGAALAFAFAQPPMTIILMFTFIGIGMALPFILIAFNPAVVKKLPKPGEWMNILKEIMGFLLLLWAVKMLDVLYFQIGGSGLISFMFFLLALALSFRIIGRFVRPNVTTGKKIIALIIAVLIIVFAGMQTLNFTDTDARLQGETDLLHGRWQAFSPELIAAARDEGKPVFIDFTAKWCTTCLVNKFTVLDADDIQEAFKEKEVELFLADFTSYDDTIAEWIQSFGRPGVPVYAFFVPGQDEPIVLPETLTKRMIFNVLDRIE